MESPVFVGRERELGQLDSFLSRALTGHAQHPAEGQACFVTGEAGSGKTALVSEFARRAQERHQDLIVAVGQSDAQTGIGDPYLPFREVLSQLTGDVDAQLARGTITPENAGRLRKLFGLSGEALVELGPDLINTFVPGSKLVGKIGVFVAEKAGWVEKLEQLTARPHERVGAGSTGIEQRHIFEQYTNVLKALAAQQPLILVLDDLQWADVASIGLLFRLGRRIGESHILVVGAYRPEEVALGRAGGRHPLEKVLAEFKRYFGDVWVDLDQAEEAEGQHFVNAFLDTAPNRLGEGFRRELYQHTGGHPLFTIELLRDMQERGDLVRDEHGQWVEGPVLNWETLPARVDGVIEERIGRLEEDLRETLTVASVEGESFTAEVVARVRTMDGRELIRQLSGELEKQHRLVSARGIQRLGAQRLSLYRFQHNLFQKYLYDDLDEVERVVLHEDVGTALEELYGDQVDQIAVQLAWHFVEAGMAEKAIHYLRRAGELAVGQFANDEAVTYFSRALDLTPETDATRYALLLAREKVYDVQGMREAQSQDLAALRELAEALNDDQARAEVALRQAHYAEGISDYPAAGAAAQTAIRLARNSQAVSLEAAGYLQWGRALWRPGDYEAARPQLEQALSLAQAAQLRRVEADSLRNLGIVCAAQGDYARGRVYFEQALAIHREVSDRQGEGHALNNLGVVCWNQGDYAGAKAYFEAALHTYREIGSRQGVTDMLNNLGFVCLPTGDHTEARTYFEQSLDICHEIGDRRGEGLALGNLGTVSDRLGKYAEAKDYLEQSLRIYREIGHRQGKGETLSYLGLLAHHMGSDEAAREYSQRALLIAQDLGDRLVQGNALTNLGHALVSLGHLAEASTAYRQALALRRELGQPNLAMESLAGLVRVSLAQGDLPQAMALVEEILSYLETDTLDGTEEPFRVYLTCYRTLKANHDPRAQGMLDIAHRLLQEQATKTIDGEMQRSFLENVTAHREIMREFEKQSEEKP